MRAAERDAGGPVRELRLAFEHLEPSELAGADAQVDRRAGGELHAIEQNLGARDARGGEQALALDAGRQDLGPHGAFVERCRQVRSSLVGGDSNRRAGYRKA